jgi:hypothetical protein
MLSTEDIITGKVVKRITKLKYNGLLKYFDCYSLSLSASSICKFGDIFVDKKIPLVNFNSKNNNIVIDGYILKRVKKITKRNYNGPVYNIEVKDDHSYVVNGCAVSNCRFFYENEPKVASAIDFYSSFPMSNWTHECSNLKVKKPYVYISGLSDSICPNIENFGDSNIVSYGTLIEGKLNNFDKNKIIFFPAVSVSNFKEKVAEIKQKGYNNIMTHTNGDTDFSLALEIFKEVKKLNS